MILLYKLFKASKLLHNCQRWYSQISLKYFHLCNEDERKAYVFGTT